MCSMPLMLSYDLYINAMDADSLMDLYLQVGLKALFVWCPLRFHLCTCVIVNEDYSCGDYLRG